MNAGKAVYGILSANTGVTDIVGTRIFPEIAEQEAVTPFVIYQLQSVAPEDTHDGPSKLDEVRFEFLCYADSYNEAADLGVAVRSALDRVSGTYNGVNVESVQFNDVDVDIEYDPRRYSQVLKFTFRIKRDDIEIALGTPVTGAVLDDLSDVKIVGTPAQGDALVYQSGFWSRGTAGASTLDELDDVDAGAPSAGQLLAYGQDTWETIDQDEIALPIGSVTGLQSELDSKAESLNDLSDVTISGTPTGNQALIYDATASVFKSTDSFTNRFEDDVERGSGNITPFVERAYGVKSDGDGIFIDNQSDTPSAGKVIKRKIYHKAGIITDTDVIGDYTLIHTFDDDTAYSATESTFEGFRDGDTYGTPPFTLIQTWEEVTAAPAFTGLLNESYGSGAEAAYSTRRLNGLYSGDCMTIRRASDGTTQSIGFVDEEIDESAIETFCTGTTCTVQVWRDQSGNGNDATQTTPANQPTIYTGGALVKEGGRLALNFDGSNDALEMSAVTTGTTHRTSFTISKCDTATPNNTDAIYGFHNAASTGALYFFTAESAIRVSGLATYSNSAQTSQSLATLTFNGTTTDDISLHLNGASKTQATTTSTTINTGSGSCAIGGSAHDSTTRFDGNIQELVFYNSDKSTDRTSIESNIGDYYTQNTPLLDTYSGAAAAYSLRKLRTAYTGNAIRVRRSNDNAEADIGWNVFGELDTVSLAAHCGSNDGFVKTWYDQSGNANDATQNTTANQPKIYDGTTGVITENGKPAVNYNGSGQHLIISNFINPTANSIYSLAGVARPDENDNLLINITDGVELLSLSYGRTSGQLSARTYDGTTFVDSSGASTISEQFLAFSKHDFNVLSSTLHIDGVSATGTNAGRGDALESTIGDGPIPSLRYNGVWQEIIIYPSDESSNRSDIEDNINTFYDIY